MSRDRPLRNVTGGEGQTAIFEEDSIPQHQRAQQPESEVRGEGAISRWNLVEDEALSDLVSGESVLTGFDILVLADDTVLASFINFATGAFDVRRYDPAGTLLNTYTIAATSALPAGTPPRLAYDVDDASFRVMYHLSSGATRIERVRVSDGEILSSVDSAQYELGTYQGDETATPIARFGNSFSCPLLVLQVAIGVQAQLPIVDSSIPLPLRRACVPYDACSPHDLNCGQVGVLLKPTAYVWEPSGAGDGTVPVEDDPDDGESWLK